MINYELSEQTPNVIKTLFNGHVDLKQLKDYAYRLSMDQRLQQDLYIIEDQREVDFDLSDNDLKTLSESVAHLSGVFQSIHIAILQNQTRTISRVIFYQTLTKSIPNYHTKLFYSENMALEWLMALKAKQEKN